MNLKAARADRFLNQYDLSILTGISQSRLSLIERGYIKPSKTEKNKICKALSVREIDIDWFGCLAKRLTPQPR